MTVEAATIDTSSAVDPAAIQQSADAPLSEDAAMDAVWDKLHPQERVERDNGKFVSPDPAKRAAAAPLEGGEGGGQQAEASTVSTDVPLPANWQGKDALWAKLPADAKAEVAQIVTEQHTKLSDMGREVSAYRPLHGVGAEVVKYLETAAQKSGAAYDGPKTPAEGVSYLFNIQRSMDADAPGTLLQIMDTYGVRDKVAALLGVKPGDGQQADPGTRENLLLAKIDRLETAIKQSADPSRIEQIVDQKTAKSEHDREVSRLLQAKPLSAEIEPDDLVFFIKKAWNSLGPDATKAAVLDHAYNAAVEANPTLRAKSQAAVQAAKDAAAKAEAAKRGTSVNVRSTASTKPAKVSEDDAMEEVWKKHHSEG